MVVKRSLRGKYMQNARERTAVHSRPTVNAEEQSSIQVGLSSNLWVEQCWTSQLLSWVYLLET